MDEEATIARILRAARAAGAATGGAGVTLGPGDDAAVLAPPLGQELVWTTDEQVEGVHFRREWSAFAGYAAFGRKAIGAGVSDLAAMGASPLGVLVGLALPELEPGALDALAAGLGEALARCETPLLGGNLTRHPDRLELHVTALGAVTPGRALRRDAGRAGDRLFVSGPLGLARAGLRWLLAGGDPHEPALAPALAALLGPTPRLPLGRALAAEPRVACLDLSDGLARDLPRLARASGLRAVVDPAALPAPDPELARRAGEPATELAWRGGEDHELLVAGPADLALRHPTLREIGRLEDGPAGEVVAPELDHLAGFDHFVAPPEDSLGRPDPKTR